MVVIWSVVQIGQSAAILLFSSSQDCSFYGNASLDLGVKFSLTLWVAIGVVEDRWRCRLLENVEIGNVGCKANEEVRIVEIEVASSTLMCSERDYCPFASP
jgi:hypothetical protein